METAWAVHSDSSGGDRKSQLTTPLLQKTQSEASPVQVSSSSAAAGGSGSQQAAAAAAGGGGGGGATAIVIQEEEGDSQ